MGKFFWAYIGTHDANKSYCVRPSASIYDYSAPILWLPLPVGQRTRLKNLMVHKNRVTVLKRPSQLRGLNPIKLLRFDEKGDSNPVCAAERSRRIAKYHINSMRLNYENGLPEHR